MLFFSVDVKVSSLQTQLIYSEHSTTALKQDVNRLHIERASFIAEVIAYTNMYVYLYICVLLISRLL